MIVLIDGPDGSGKSTLSKYLIDEKKFSYIHSSIHEDMDNYFNQLADMLEIARQAHLNVVLDRSILSNVVYVEISGVPLVKQSTTRRLYELIDKIVICLPTKEKYIEQYEKLKSERFEMFDSMTDVYDKYYKLYISKDCNGTTLSDNKVYIYNMFDYNNKQKEYVKRILNI